MMRTASFDAGMISDVNSAKLVLCLEPEAACMACEHERISKTGAQAAGGGQQILRADQTFMVLDCGGGTVDITMHRVEKTDPLRLSEVHEPTGSWAESLFYIGGGMYSRTPTCPADSK